MRNLASVVVSLLAFAAVNTANAADLALKEPPPASVYSWTGFYIGGDVGGAWTSNTGIWTPLPSPTAFGANIISGSNGGSAAIGGLHAGYNWQFAPAWVAGIEGDWSWTRASGSFTQLWTVIPPAVLVPGSFTAMSSRLDWVSSLRVRLGYLVTPGLLAYGTAGVAWARIAYAANDSNFVGNATNVAFSQTPTGFAVGGGFEWAMTNNLLLRSEYLFYRFSGTSVVAQAPAFPIFPSGYSWSSTNVSVARLGLSYRF